MGPEARYRVEVNINSKIQRALVVAPPKDTSIPPYEWLRWRCVAFVILGAAS